VKGGEENGKRGSWGLLIRDIGKREAKTSKLSLRGEKKEGEKGEEWEITLLIAAARHETGVKHREKKDAT